MPEGALLTNTVEAVLHDLALSGATGCLTVRDQKGDEAQVFLRDGEVYAVMVPGRRVMLGVRLMSRGALTPEALAEALEIQRTELQGWRLGELLVHLGYVELAVVEEFVVEHLKDALADLLGWPVSAWKFRKNKKTRQDVAPPTSVAELFDNLRDRATTWETILESIGGPDAVPTLAAGPPSDEAALGPNEWALLCKVDALRSVAELAGNCGFTLFEAGQVVSRLLDAGLVSIVAGADTDTNTDADVPVLLEVEEPDESGSELLLPLLLVAEADTDVDAVPVLDKPVPTLEAVLIPDAGTPDGSPTPAELAVQAEVTREQEAAELHRQLEALAVKEAAAREERAAARRLAKEQQDELARRREVEAERAAAEEQAWADHAGWLAAEKTAEECAARESAEGDAWAEHEAWLAEQRRGAEVQAWEEHARWLAERAAEEAARAEAERAADEVVRAERAAQEEAERAAREEAERAAEAAARDEAEQRAAREQAERELQAEADRRAHELAERELLAEAERVARAAAEQEAARVATEQEATRVAAEQEAARVAAEQEAARVAEQTVAREASERAARESAEQETEDENVAAGAAQAARAASMLTELNRDAPDPVAPAVEPEAGPEPAEDDAVPVDTGPAPMVARDHADTAMLLRELSSLGFGMDERPSPPTPPAPRPNPSGPSPAASADAKRKRKGLFGRG